MGVVDNEQQEKRGNVLAALSIAVILAIPFINMLAGAILVVQWGLKILIKSSSMFKDLGLFLGFAAAVSLAAFFGLDNIGQKNVSYVMVFLPPFIVAFFGSLYLLNNIKSLHD